MNVATLFLIILVAVGAVFGIIAIGAHQQQGFTDSYNNTLGNETNSTQVLMGNVTATGTQVGAGVVVLVGGIIFAVIFLVLITKIS